VGYWSEPTQHDIDHIREELNTDPEFGLVDQMDKYVLVKATPEMVADHFNFYKDIKKSQQS